MASVNFFPHSKLFAAISVIYVRVKRICFASILRSRAKGYRNESLTLHEATLRFMEIGRCISAARNEANSLCIRITGALLTRLGLYNFFREMHFCPTLRISRWAFRKFEIRKNKFRILFGVSSYYDHLRIAKWHFLNFSFKIKKQTRTRLSSHERFLFHQLRGKLPTNITNVNKVLFFFYLNPFKFIFI